MKMAIFPLLPYLQRPLFILSLPVSEAAAAAVARSFITTEGFRSTIVHNRSVDIVLDP